MGSETPVTLPKGMELCPWAGGARANAAAKITRRVMDRVVDAEWWMWSGGCGVVDVLTSEDSFHCRGNISRRGSGEVIVGTVWHGFDTKSIPVTKSEREAAN
jgi:hypothetical protein